MRLAGRAVAAVRVASPPVFTVQSLNRSGSRDERRRRHVPACVRFIAVAVALAGGVALAADAPAKKNPRLAKPAPASRALKLPEATPDQEKAAELVYYGLYDCEFSKHVNILGSTAHRSYVDVKHGKTTWLMKPVLSTTGAVRLRT